MPVKYEEKGINVAIDPDVYWKLKQLALNEHITLRSLIMQVLREFVDVAEKTIHSGD